jgi:aspartyl-tRNA(Asn)/glutamyl-tRNA(Gln) amidotransferase subunit A
MCEVLFNEYEVLILPTTPIAAPVLAGEDAVERARQLTRFTAPFNLTGMPALSIPCGFTKNGLPIGLQIASRAWNETSVLRTGYAFQSVTDWHTRKHSTWGELGT